MKQLTNEQLEKVDDITNEIMDALREEFAINEDSDQDDEVYGYIHNKIKHFYEENLK
jgi:hypothetical protein